MPDTLPDTALPAPAGMNTPLGIFDDMGLVDEVLNELLESDQRRSTCAAVIQAMWRGRVQRRRLSMQ